MLTASVQRGIGLVESLVVLVIMALLLALAAPSFSTWIAGTRVRATAESLLAGLQYARSEATTRNTQVRFQLTTSVDDGCALSTSGLAWVVDMVDAGEGDSVAGQCGTAPSDTVAPSILQVRAAAEAGGRVQVAAGASEIVFNGLGRRAPTGGAAAPAAVAIDVAPAGAERQCVADGGGVTCLRILVSPAGQVRLCNPSAPEGDSQACA
ncbi:MAG: GspH/FimT family pseudopilin [Roseateles sp.]|uniref:GspH/FimT family pseudopilin n=1 Tax=Roseateles sp. TaxID=1971397 RepID=UPI0039E98392